MHALSPVPVASMVVFVSVIVLTLHCPRRASLPSALALERSALERERSALELELHSLP